MPIDSLIMDGHDRAAPQGVGHVKASGNYGADILPSLRAKALGLRRDAPRTRAKASGSVDIPPWRCRG